MKKLIAFLFLWLLILLGNVALWGGLIWVVIHFVKKFW